MSQVNLHRVVRARLWSVRYRTYLAVKRAFDVAVSLLLLLLLLPLFGTVAACIVLESGRPIFYSQTRVTRHGRLFRCWKFRSMRTDSDGTRAALESEEGLDGGVRFKMKRDPRITRVGSFIRKSSIDELPQLWNVLCGDMTLVGPRPPIPAEVDAYSPTDRRRLEVRQGITCIWQVSGRSDVPFDKQVEMDVEYSKEQSLWKDLVLLVRTIPAVLLRRGAY